MAASHFSCTYGFSGRHRPHPKARQADARLAVPGRLCRIGVFTYDTTHVETGLVGRMGASSELGAFPAGACPARRSQACSFLFWRFLAPSIDDHAYK